MSDPLAKRPQRQPEEEGESRSQEKGIKEAMTDRLGTIECHKPRP